MRTLILLNSTRSNHQISNVYWLIIDVERRHALQIESKEGERSLEDHAIVIMFEGDYATLLHTGDNEEADNLIDNIMCLDMLIKAIFVCERVL